MGTKGEMGQTTRSIQVILKARNFLEKGVHIARCDALGISDHGDTQEEAFFNLGKTLGLFMGSCAKRGTIERVLESKGIEYTSVGGEPDGSDHVCVPIVLLSEFNASTTGAGL